MMILKFKIYMVLLGAFITLISANCDIIEDLHVKHSSADYKSFKKANAIDGEISNESRWIGSKGNSDNIWLEIELLKECSVKALALFSGFGESNAVEDFHMQFKNKSGEWEEIQSSRVSGNSSVNRLVSFKNPVQAKSFKLVINKTKDDLARVKELILYSKTPTTMTQPYLDKKLDSGHIKVYPELLTADFGDVKVAIDPKGFKFSFRDKNGAEFAPANSFAGLRISNEPAFITGINSKEPNSYQIVTKKGQKAVVTVHYKNSMLKFTTRSESSLGKVSLALGGMPVAYGLGDAGGWSNLNLIGEKAKHFNLINDGGRFRWLSSFVVFPLNRLAGVALQGKSPRVSLGSEVYSMSVNAKQEVSFHYFIGEMKEIYKNYRKQLDLHNYPNVKPKFRLFELGWESWAALGWQTDANTVLRSIKKFQKNGYPIRWAVTGSGFWEKGGTTTSFGKFGDKFPKPYQFKKSLNGLDVKWMIGLRTNFVLPGGPHTPKTKKRDKNLKVKTINGNPLSTEGLKKGYFVKTSEKPLTLTSTIFPIVPCYMLDGRNKNAASWYAKNYKKWNVDGIKEDTMMRLSGDLLDIFNHPIAKIADEKGLVMARCGSFSSPGTLLRINDTKVQEVKKRTPVNYLQYAASGAPNVYSDTVGFHKMKRYSEVVVSQAWLTALTAGMAVGETPFHWSAKEQEIFKKPFDFHYKIAPHMYDAAVKSFETGFPYTMTPMGIAFAGDKQATTTPNYQWMIGESLLCVPKCKNPSDKSIDVYLPEGVWFDFDTGKKFEGPQLLKNFSMPPEKTPCFVGGSGIIITRAIESNDLTIKLYPTGKSRDKYVFNHPDGQSISILSFSKNSNKAVWDIKARKKIRFETCQKSGAISFNIKPGRSYKLEL